MDFAIRSPAFPAASDIGTRSDGLDRGVVLVSRRRSRVASCLEVPKFARTRHGSRRGGDLGRSLAEFRTGRRDRMLPGDGRSLGDSARGRDREFESTQSNRLRSADKSGMPDSIDRLSDKPGTSSAISSLRTAQTIVEKVFQFCLERFQIFIRFASGSGLNLVQQVL